MKTRFRRYLEHQGFCISDDQPGDVAVPGDTSLDVHARIIRGLADEDTGTRSCSLLEIVVPSLELHMTAISDFTSTPDEWSDQFEFVAARGMAGNKRHPLTMMLDGPLKGSRWYKTNRAARGRDAGEVNIPWLTFTIGGSEPKEPSPSQFPLFHRRDLRRCVESPSEHVIVVEGQSYVNASGLRPFGRGQGDLAIITEVFRRSAGDDLADLWGLLNSKWYDDPRTQQRWAPFQNVLDWGWIHDLRRNDKRPDGSYGATGTFTRLTEEFVSPWLSESELAEIALTLQEDHTVTTVVGGAAQSMPAIEAIEEDELSLELVFSKPSLRRFLDHASQIQEQQESLKAARPYGRILEVLRALDPFSMDDAIGATIQDVPEACESLLRLTPREAHSVLVKPLKEIAAAHGVSLDTVKRRLQEDEIKPIARYRPSAIPIHVYENKRSIFISKYPR